MAIPASGLSHELLGLAGIGVLVLGWVQICEETQDQNKIALHFTTHAQENTEEEVGLASDSFHVLREKCVE